MPGHPHHADWVQHHGNERHDDGHRDYGHREDHRDEHRDR